MSSTTTPGAEARAYSRALRQGIVLYDFKPTEVLLLLILCEETFDRDQFEQPLNLESWAASLAQPVRKLKPVWQELITLGVIDFNQGQGTYQLRPDLNVWSRMRGLRVPTNLRTGSELPLTVERPLDESLSSLSRESVLSRADHLGSQVDNTRPGPLQSNPAVRVDFPRLIEAIGRGTVAEEFPDYCPAEKSAGPGGEIIRGPVDKSAGAVAEKSAGHKTQQNGVFARFSGGPAEKSAAPIASLASLKTSKLAIGEVAEKFAEAWRWLEEIDVMRHLQVPNCAKQWHMVCKRDPVYVLEKLKPALIRAQARLEVSDPLAYLARKCRDERRFK